MCNFELVKALLHLAVRRIQVTPHPFVSIYASYVKVNLFLGRGNRGLLKVWNVSKDSRLRGNTA